MSDERLKCSKCGGWPHGDKDGKRYCHSYKNGRTIQSNEWDYGGLGVSKFPDGLYRGDGIVCGNIEATHD